MHGARPRPACVPPGIGQVPCRTAKASVPSSRWLWASWIPRRGGRTKDPGGRRAAQCYGRTSRRGDGRTVALISATAAMPGVPGGPGPGRPRSLPAGLRHTAGWRHPHRGLRQPQEYVHDQVPRQQLLAGPRPARDGSPMAGEVAGSVHRVQPALADGVREGSRRARSVLWPEDPRDGRGDDRPLRPRLTPRRISTAAVITMTPAASNQTVARHSRRLARHAHSSSAKYRHAVSPRRADHRRALIPPRRHGCPVPGHADDRSCR